MRRWSIVLAVFAVVTALGTSRAQALPLSFSFTDSVNDAFGCPPSAACTTPFPNIVGPVTDVVGLFFSFDNATGDYEATMIASAANPFIGDVTVNVNLFNGDTGTHFFNSSKHFLNTPSTSITLTGSNLQLLAWQAGDQVAACEGPGGIIPEPCLGGLGSSIDFSSGVINFQAGSQTARDGTQSSPPATIVAAVPEPSGQLVTYDRFLKKPLDAEKWVPNGISFGVLDVRREVSGKRARLKLRAYADTTTNIGRQTHNNALEFPAGIQADITRIRVKAEVKTAKQIACATNPNPGNGRLLLPRIGGQWFNDGTCVTPPCLQSNGNIDFLGDMFAVIELRQNSNMPDGAKVFRIVAQLFHCSDPTDRNCSVGGTTLLFDTTTLGTLRLRGRGKIRKVTLDIEWDAANNRFIYRRDKRPPLFASYPSALNQGPASFPGKEIFIQGRVQNCDLTGPTPQERPTAEADVRIKRVQINASALP